MRFRGRVGQMDGLPPGVDGVEQKGEAASRFQMRWPMFRRVAMERAARRRSSSSTVRR